MKAIQDRIEAALIAAQATTVDRHSNAVSFSANLFRMVGNWNILVQTDSGAIEIIPGAPTSVRYTFSCRKMLIVTTTMMVVMAFFVFLSEGISEAAIVFAGGWLWLFGMNYLIAAIRLPLFVRRITKNTGG